MRQLTKHTWRHVLRGGRDSLPMCVGVFPVGLSFGLLAVQGGLSIWEAFFMSAIVFAGSAQFMALGMLGQGASIAEIVVSTFLMNLRHLVMSTYVMNRLQQTRLPKKLALAFNLCDESFALFSLKTVEQGDEDYLLGVHVTLYLVWLGSTVGGCLLLSVLPAVISDSLGIAFYAAFIRLLLPNLRGSGRLYLLVLLTFVINFALSHVMPASLATIFSILLGAGLGVWLVPDLEPKEDSV